MDLIQSTKLELMQLLLNTNKIEVLQRVKEVFEKESEDFWDDLTVEDQNAINEGLSQLDKGEYVSHESIKEEIKNRFNI
jgi:predicted transcriptional regulator